VAKLKSGDYALKVGKTVVIWPAPDKDGDGGEVWVPEVDPVSGMEFNRQLQTDPMGNEVREYNPPEGFRNLPGYDHTDNYVKVDRNGRIQRDRNGAAINIKPGEALVFNADGTIEHLTGEYAQHLFALAHDAVVSETVDPSED